MVLQIMGVSFLIARLLILFPILCFLGRLHHRVGSSFESTDSLRQWLGPPRVIPCPILLGARSAPNFINNIGRPLLEINLTDDIFRKFSEHSLVNFHDQNLEQ
jgi:hypothetical protein